MPVLNIILVCVDEADMEWWEFYVVTLGSVADVVYKNSNFPSNCFVEKFKACQKHFYLRATCYVKDWS